MKNKKTENKGEAVVELVNLLFEAKRLEDKMTYEERLNNKTKMGDIYY